MPLPPALLARLQRRGIVKAGANEEVIAENYESPENKEKKPKEEREFAVGCPNKYNPYHICVDFCYDHWREGHPESRLSEEYLKRRKRMLTRFPLPEPWTEIYDAGIRRHYYWNPETDEVCWLSPRHPSAVIGEPAPKVAKEMFSQIGEERIDEEIPIPAANKEEGRREKEKEKVKERERDRGGDRSSDRRRKRKNSDSDSDSEEPDRPELSDKDRLRRAQRKGIDPMDPAAYSDIKVGKWSSGLREDTKTGVDVTAGGPLFQQRPYPAPGAVLRAQKKRDKDSDDDD